MATNEIKPFGAEGTVANGDVLDLAAYDADAQRLTGNQAGIARRDLVNTVLRQTSHLCAALGQFIANRAEVGVLDDGDLDALEGGFVEALMALDLGYAELGVAQVWTKQQAFGLVDLTYASTVSWDLDNQVARLTLTGSPTIAAPTNMVAGAQYQLILVQDATGGWTPSWNAAFVWPGDVAPDIQTDAGARTVLTFVCENNLLRGVSVGYTS